eukprot:5405779-Pyramimonas_sp.AAC.1
MKVTLRMREVVVMLVLLVVRGARAAGPDAGIEAGVGIDRVFRGAVADAGLSLSLPSVDRARSSIRKVPTRQRAQTTCSPRYTDRKSPLRIKALCE